MTNDEQKRVEEIRDDANHRKWCVDPMKNSQQIVTTIEDLKRSNECIFFLLSIIEQQQSALDTSEMRAEAAIAQIKHDCETCSHKHDGECNWRSLSNMECWEWNDPTKER